MYEVDIDRKVVTYATAALGLTCIKLSGTSFNGLPDRMFLIPGGRPFFIEFKRAGKPLRPLQQERHQQLKSLGYDVEAHDDAETAKAAIKERLDYAMGTA